MKKLLLSVTKNHALDEIPEKAVSKILSATKSCCAACGINISKNYKIHQEDSKNQYALCPLCFYSQHLDKLDPKAAGHIIVLPELDQIELLSLARSIECIIQQKEKYPEEAEAVEIIQILLKDRAEMATTFFAQEISDPTLLSQVLYSLNDEQYSKREQCLYSLRWLPDMSFFENDIKLWEEDLDKYTPKTEDGKNWIKIIDMVSKKIED